MSESGDTAAGKDLVRERAVRYVENCSEYSSAYERERLVENWRKKEAMAEGVVEDFARRATSVPGTEILEVGFGNGDYIIAFGRAGAQVTGIEINEVLRDIAQARITEEGVDARVAVYDGRTFPYDAGIFDAVVAISVLEHTSDPKLLLSEAARVLRPSGVMYLAFPNRWWPRETHSGFWLIGYLPRSLARAVLRLWGLSTVDELNLHFISYPRLKRLLRCTGLSIRLEHGQGIRGVLKRVLAALGIHHSILLPHIMVVLDKEG